MTTSWNASMGTFSLPNAVGATKPSSRHFHSSYHPPMLKLPAVGVGFRLRRVIPSAGPRLDDTSLESGQQQVDLSVLRFTLGIPGLDESYLPRYIGVAFGSLLVLNHFLTTGLPTTAQLTTEALGISLAAFSAVLPYFGKFLKGASPVDRLSLPEGNRQIFVMSENLSDIMKEDLAWESFVLLRNTNTMSVLISVQGALCIRGYWNAPEDASKTLILDWFKRQIREIGLSNLNDAIYFPRITADQPWGILPNGTRSLLLQPIMGISDQSNFAKEKIAFVLLVSSASYAYRDRDRAWIRAIANKFQVYLL